MVIVPLSEKAKKTTIVVMSAFAGAFASNYMNIVWGYKFPMNVVLLVLGALFLFGVVYIGWSKHL